MYLCVSVSMCVCMCVCGRVVLVASLQKKKKKKKKKKTEDVPCASHYFCLAVAGSMQALSGVALVPPTLHHVDAAISGAAEDRSGLDGVLGHDFMQLLGMMTSDFSPQVRGLQISRRSLCVCLSVCVCVCVCLCVEQIGPSSPCLSPFSLSLQPRPRRCPRQSAHGIRSRTALSCRGRTFTKA